MRWKRAIAALATAGIFTGLGAGAATAQPVSASSHLYQIYTNTYGIPKSVKAGTTFYADAWYMQDSPVRLGALDYSLIAWSYSTSTAHGFTVSWLNPVTHRWQASTQTDWEGSLLSLIPEGPYGFTMLPHHWYKIQFKVTVGKNVHPGTWHLSTSVDGITGPNGTQAPPMEWLGSPDRLMRVRH
jgi:hypothetical protein